MFIINRLYEIATQPHASEQYRLFVSSGEYCSKDSISLIELLTLSLQVAFSVPNVNLLHTIVEEVGEDAIIEDGYIITSLSYYIWKHHVCTKWLMDNPTFVKLAAYCRNECKRAVNDVVHDQIICVDDYRQVSLAHEIGLFQKTRFAKEPSIMLAMGKWKCFCEAMHLGYLTDTTQSMFALDLHVISLQTCHTFEECVKILTEMFEYKGMRTHSAVLEVRKKPLVSCFKALRELFEDSQTYTHQKDASSVLCRVLRRHALQIMVLEESECNLPLSSCVTDYVTTFM
jgi:hypothetical protein